MLTWMKNLILGARINPSNCSKILLKEVKKIEKFKAISDRSSISEVTKRQLWRREASGKMDTHCYCCLTEVSMDGQKDVKNKNKEKENKEKIHRKTSVWHAGHILSVAHGGSDHVDNLRILCTDCNLLMGSCHMYEYIVDKKMKGIKNLSFFDSWHWKKVISDRNLATVVISDLKVKRYITEHLSRRLVLALNPKKYPISIRLPLIHQLLEAGTILLP